MELRHLKYFVAVAEELHFGRAAQRLHIAQPALSRQIQNLESEMRVDLFSRDRRRVELTHAGAIFLKEARAILENVGHAVIQTRRAKLGEVGRIEVGHSPAADPLLLPQVVSAFRAHFPEVNLVLHHLSGPALHHALKEGHIQIALLRLPVDDTGFETIQLLSERFVAALPAKHRLAGQADISLRDLAGEPIIQAPRRLGTRYHDTIAAFCAESGGFKLALSQESETIQSTLGLVAAGLGVSLQPESIRNMPRVGVVYREIRETSPCVATGIAYDARNASPLVRNFVNVAVDVMAPALPG